MESKMPSNEVIQELWEQSIERVDILHNACSKPTPWSYAFKKEAGYQREPQFVSIITNKDNNKTVKQTYMPATTVSQLATMVPFKMSTTSRISPTEQPRDLTSFPVPGFEKLSISERPRKGSHSKRGSKLSHRAKKSRKPAKQISPVVPKKPSNYPPHRSYSIPIRLVQQKITPVELVESKLEETEIMNDGDDWGWFVDPNDM